MPYDFRAVEKKWIDKYRDYTGYKGVDFEEKKKKYVLVEFPYPSGSGLHVGHAFSMTGADVYARYMRAKGFNVVFPMGWDAFGLPTENYAIKMGKKPQLVTAENTAMFKKQMERLALSFDWEREVNTTDPSYYKWTQWIFLKLFEKGLAEKKEMPINWCPSCKIGLANEEVMDGKCERCGEETEKRTISQWVVRITDYADKLLEGLKNTKFIEKVKAAQVNWIDKREGAKISFEVKGFDKPRLEVFTTRPDTLEGVTFMVIAPEHFFVGEAIKTQPDRVEEIKRYVEQSKKRSEIERSDVTKEKTGVFSGLYAINPISGKEIPVWIADYVLASYGTGAIMAVPSHDERDGAFAEKYGLEVNREYTPDETMIERVVEKGAGERSVNYHLRDWIFSRQHYWGEPIPMIFCSKCGWVGVPEDQLPVRLPEVERYQPTDTGESPLAGIESFVTTTCPKCKGEARRETDTMPNWAGSDWYFLRYCDNKNDKVLADMKKMEYWLPVDVYVGGDEHNTLHLLYSRFIYQFLFDLGVVPRGIPEPYEMRLSHGVILGTDGNRMSKSRGNVIVPDQMADVYGIDVLRTYMMFMGPFDATMAWNERSMVGVKRFIEKIYGLVEQNVSNTGDSSEKIRGLVYKKQIKIEEDLEQFKFNTAIAKMMELVNDLIDTKEAIGKTELRVMTMMLGLFAPYAAEEMWNLLGNDFSVHGVVWEKPSEAYLVEEKVVYAVQVNGKLRASFECETKIDDDGVVEMAKNLPNVKKYLSEGEVKKTIFVRGRMVSFVVA